MVLWYDVLRENLLQVLLLLATFVLDLVELHLLLLFVVLLILVFLFRFRPSFFRNRHSVGVIALSVLPLLDEILPIVICEFFRFELMLVDFVEHVLDDPNVKIRRTVELKYFLLLAI